MSIQGTWREKLLKSNAYDLLIDADKRIRTSKHISCVIDIFMDFGSYKHDRCRKYFDSSSAQLKCEECIQDFLNEVAK